MSKYYYYGFRGTNLTKICSQLLEIISSEAIKPKRSLGFTVANGYNGLDYVSICQKKTDGEYQRRIQEGYLSAYSWYIHNHFCFIISENVKAITPELVSVFHFQSIQDFVQHCFHDLDERYSDMFDEYQVKGEIPLSKIVGIGIPTTEIETRQEEEIQDSLMQLLNAAQEKEWDVVDTSDFHFVDQYESLKETGKEKVYQISRGKRNLDE